MDEEQEMYSDLGCSSATPNHSGTWEFTQWLETASQEKKHRLNAAKIWSTVPFKILKAYTCSWQKDQISSYRIQPFMYYKNNLAKLYFIMNFHKFF